MNFVISGSSLTGTHLILLLENTEVSHLMGPLTNFTEKCLKKMYLVCDLTNIWQHKLVR